MNDNEQRLSGGCFCGSIRYEAAGEPFWVGYCHCTSCRRQTGAPVVMFAGYNKEQIIFSGSERKIYHSSTGVSRGFCKECGTPLTWEGDSNKPGRGEIIEVYISTLDEPERLKPTNHLWYSARISWFDTHDNLPRFREFDFNSDVIPKNL